MMLPCASTTTRQCSQRASTPSSRYGGLSPRQFSIAFSGSCPVPPSQAAPWPSRCATAGRRPGTAGSVRAAAASSSPGRAGSGARRARAGTRGSGSRRRCLARRPTSISRGPAACSGSSASPRACTDPTRPGRQSRPARRRTRSRPRAFVVGKLLRHHAGAQRNARRDAHRERECDSNGFTHRSSVAGFHGSSVTGSAQGPLPTPGCWLDRLRP